MNFLPLKFYIVSSFINFGTSFILGFVLLKNFRSKPSRLFSLFSFSVAFWSFLYSIWLLTGNKELAEFYLRTCMIGVLFMPSLFIHFVTIFLGKPKSTKFYTFNYLLSTIFALTVYTPLYASNPEKHLVFPYWLHPGPVFHIALAHFIIIVIYAFLIMYEELKTAKGIFRNQLLYVFWGTAIGYFGGTTNFFCWYRIPIPPVLNSFVALYVGFVTYAIAKYKLLDIHFIIKRGVTNLILIGTISIVFVLITLGGGGGGGERKELGLEIFLIILVSTILVMFLPKLKIRTENVINHLIYKDKYKYQDKLETFIDNMPFIPREKDLFTNTIKTIFETIGIKKAAIFTLDDITNNYRLRDQKGIDISGEYKISSNNGIVSWLQENKEVFIREEIEKTLASDELRSVREVLNQLDASLCVPVMLKENLIGIITLGEKSSGDMYSHIDTRILRRLGNQLALALDYKRMEIEYRREHELAIITSNRLNTITSMSYGLADRINNYLFSITIFLGEFSEKLKLLEDKLPDNVKESLKTLHSTSSTGLDKMIKLSKEITNLCKPQGLNLQLYESKIIMDIAGEVTEEFKKEMRTKEIQIDKKIEGIPPSTCFDKEAIKKVLWHLIQNAIHAIPEGRRGLIRIKVAGPIRRDEKEFMRILVEDNGIGIPRENVEDIFNPFFTTKGTSGGLGLGLTICQFIVNQHEGIIEVAHSQLDKGTTIYVDLPVRTEPPKPTTDYKDILGMFPARRSK